MPLQKQFSQETVRAAVVAGALRLYEERKLRADAERRAQRDVELAMPDSPSAMAVRVAPTRWDATPKHTQLLDQALVYLDAREAPAWWMRRYMLEQRPGSRELVPCRCEGYEDDDLVPFTRLIIEEPPRHGKSTHVSEFFPAWYLGRHPWHHVMAASYEARLAARNSGRARDLLQTWGPTLFGRGVNQRRRARDDWELEGTQGGMSSSGVGGAMTGRGANVLLIDDPVKNADEARSQTIQERNWDWFRSTAMSRLEEDEDGLPPVVAIIMTRWDEGDLVGKILDQDEDERDEGEHFVVLRLPAIAEENDPLGRQPGEALWPERRSLRFLEGMRRRLGSYFFSALYQQRPVPAGGGIFKRGWWQRYRVLPREARRGRGAIIIDTATDDKSTGDNFAMATIRTGGLGFYWTDMLAERLAFPDQVRAALDARNASKTPENPAGLPIYIEEVPWALPLIKTLRKLVTRVIGVKPGGHSKISRAMAATPYVEGGDCFLPEDAPWVAGFIDEHAAFPSVGWHDDQVDTTSLGLFVLGTRAIPVRTDAVGVAVEYGGNVPGDPPPRTPTARAKVERQRQEREKQRLQRDQRARPPGQPRRRGGV